MWGLFTSFKHRNLPSTNQTNSNQLSVSSGKYDFFKKVSFWMCRFSAYHSFRYLSQISNSLFKMVNTADWNKVTWNLASIFNDVSNMRISIWGKNRMNLHSSIMALCSATGPLYLPSLTVSIKVKPWLWKCSSNVTVSAILLNVFICRSWKYSVAIFFLACFVIERLKKNPPHELLPSAQNM